MLIETLQFGVLDIDEDSIITFGDGMPGFETCQRFKLLHDDSPSPRVLWMQSLDVPDVMFSVIDASLLGFNYQLTLTEEEVAKIGGGSPAEIVLLLTLSKEPTTGQVRPHPNSPIVLNTATRKALQKSGMRSMVVFTNS